MEKIPKFNKHRAFNKAVGPGKNPKLINVGPTFIPDYRVGQKSVKNLVGLLGDLKAPKSHSEIN